MQMACDCRRCYDETPVSWAYRSATLNIGVKITEVNSEYTTRDR